MQCSCGAFTFIDRAARDLRSVVLRMTRMTRAAIIPSFCLCPYFPCRTVKLLSPNDVLLQPQPKLWQG